jgi:4-amino-4-deoxy-L-arabinose transferase-like glycosyltransferase
VSRTQRALVLAVAGALAVRLLLLVARGDYIVYDEGYYLLLARSLRAGHGFALNGLPHVALSPLQPTLVALASAAGVPDLWASRVLAALCGALLVLPVAALARLAGGEKAAVPAAVLTAASPALMSFVPFFPGASWNLYFGSEPLFLLLAFTAVACAVRADRGSWLWWPASGALAALAYLTRLEGAVLAGALLVVLAARVVVRREGAAKLGHLALAVTAGAVVAAPYLLYLHRELGRWALSGRVQAAAVGPQAEPAQAARGGDVLTAFTWQGEGEAFYRALYGLDATGTRMRSQYWGIHHGGGQRNARLPTPGPEPSTPTADSVRAPTVRRSLPRIWWDGVTAVTPWWLLTVALVGLAVASARALAWIVPLAVCAVVPSVLAYVEPRSLLPLAPLAAIYAAVAVTRLQERLADRAPRFAVAALPALAVLGLLWPAARDGARAYRALATSAPTPLQEVAAARRAVGVYLGRHLAPDAAVMSWHPAVAIWARREWRVLPYASFERIMAYARLEDAAAVVFSRFEPSPIPSPPRAFTIVLPGADTATASGGRVELQPVDETPLLFVGRVAAPAAR